MASCAKSFLFKTCPARDLDVQRHIAIYKFCRIAKSKIRVSPFLIPSTYTKREDWLQAIGNVAARPEVWTVARTSGQILPFGLH